MITKDSSLENNKRVIFPSGVPDTIDKILSKHGIEEDFEKYIERAAEAKTDQKAREIVEDYPGIKISTTLKKIVKGKIKKADLGSFLKEQLNISEEKAEKIAQDLKKEVLSATKRVVEKKQESPAPKEIQKLSVSEKITTIPEVEKPSKKSKIPKKQPPKKETKEEKTLKEKDSYREPIE